jgi:phage-related protein (TIGR01555 family)
MAMDDGIGGVTSWANNTFALQSGWNYGSAFAEGLAFPGYPFLSELAQRPEYRRLSEIISTEMTRKWIEIKSSAGDERDLTEKIAELTDACEDFKVQAHFRKVCEIDGFFGRGHLYIDTGSTNNIPELKLPIGNGRNALSRQKVRPGMLRGFIPVEPVWTYPTNYDSIDPLTTDWYEPDTWFVMGKEVHKTRLLKFVGREVPDLLKPAYSFGGLSMSQMAIPYVNNWLNIRQNVANITQAFSVFNLATDLSSLLADGGDQLINRANVFNFFRNNQGLMLTNKDTEEFQNISAPLSSLPELQAQAQEHICSITGIPLVKYTGLSPHGLNASSEGEMRSFYDWIHAYQEALYRVHLTTVLDFIMLHIWGEVEEDITFEFKPLFELDEKSLAEMRRVESQTDIEYVNSGILSQEEVRARVAGDPDSPYASIDPSDMPPLRLEEEMGLMPKSGAARLTEGAAEEAGQIDVPTRGAPGAGPGQSPNEADDKEPFEEGALRPEYLEGKNPLNQGFLKGKRNLDPDYLNRQAAAKGLSDEERGSPKNRAIAEQALALQAQRKGGQGVEATANTPIPEQADPAAPRIQERQLDQGDNYLKGKVLDKDFLLKRRSAKEPVTGENVPNVQGIDSAERRLAHDEAHENQLAFDANGHKRDKEGQYVPYSVGLKLNGLPCKFSKVGFSANGKHKYYSEHGDMLIIEPPGEEGGWSSHWTLYPKLGEKVSGKGKASLCEALSKLRGRSAFEETEE